VELLDTFYTPIVVIIYNRPDKTQKIISALAKIKPKSIFLIADGPKAYDLEDLKLVEATRIEFEKINWGCVITKNFAETNMGLRKRIETGLDWVFQIVDAAIILEDDCIPTPSFFNFCEVLLKKYQYEKKISMISGNNPYPKLTSKLKTSYFYSDTPLIWGWATWSDRWSEYKLNEKIWNNLLKRTKLILSIFLKNKSIFNTLNYYRTISKTYKGKIDTWDFRWALVINYRNRFCIVPQMNLVTNIGMDGSGVHFNNKNESHPIQESYEIPHQILSPKRIKLAYKRFYRKHSLIIFGKPKLINLIKKYSNR
jgi:hypothetical protein